MKIEPMSFEELKSSIINYLNKNNVIIEEYCIKPRMKDNEYTGKVDIEIVLNQPIYEV